MEPFHFEGEELLGEAYVQALDVEKTDFTEFLAPELVEFLAEGPEEQEDSEDVETFRECYSFETDRYFMAVYLFEYFFHTGSPFEGKKMVNLLFPFSRGKGTVPGKRRTFLHGTG